MWWNRSPAGGGLAGPPGGERRPIAAAIAVVAVAAIVVGLFLPVLGVSLLAFLLLDAIRQALRGRDTWVPPEPNADQPDETGTFGEPVPSPQVQE